MPLAGSSGLGLFWVSNPSCVHSLLSFTAMGAILAWLARWGRVIAGYLLVIAALVTLCNAINSLIGYAIPNLLNADSLYSRITGAFESVISPLKSMLHASGPDSDSFGQILLYCLGFEGLISGIDLLVSMISAAVSVTSGILLSAFAALLTDFIMRKTRWFGNAVAGVNAGGD